MIIGGYVRGGRYDGQFLTSVRIADINTLLTLLICLSGIYSVANFLIVKSCYFFLKTAEINGCAIAESPFSLFLESL